MHRRRIAITLALCGALLAACSTLDGSQNVISSRGPIKAAEKSKGLEKDFATSVFSSEAATGDDGAARLMLNNGFALVYSNCNAYFDSAGKNQSWLLVTRDGIGALGVISTAALTLHKGNTGSIAAVALGTSALDAGIDIYTKDFLFSADNIDAVRTLVNKALAVHQAAVLAIKPLTYQSAITALVDDQAICTPRHIAALALSAIKNGTVTASYSVQDDLNAIGNNQDQAQLRSLGSLLNPPGSLTQNQAVALWWLLKDSSTPEERIKYIAPNLVDIPDANNPFNAAHTYFDASGNFVAAWPLETQIDPILSKFSSMGQAAFETAIATTRQGAAAKAAVEKQNKLFAAVAAKPVPTVPPLAVNSSGNSTPVSAHVVVDAH